MKYTQIWTPANQTPNSIKKSPFWESNISSAHQEIPCTSQNTKVYQGVHKGPPLVPIISQVKLVHTLQTQSHKIPLFPLGFLIKTHTRIFLLCHDCHFIILQLITLLIYDKDYKSWSYPLGNLLPSPLTSSLLDASIPLSTLLPHTGNLCSFPSVWAPMGSTSTQNLETSNNLELSIRIQFCKDHQMTSH